MDGLTVCGAEVGRDLPEVTAPARVGCAAAGSTMLVVSPALTNQM